MAKYQVIVGNVGTVYDGDNAVNAFDIYRGYKDYSIRGIGRPAGESVTFMFNGEPVHEYYGTVEE